LAFNDVVQTAGRLVGGDTDAMDADQSQNPEVPQEHIDAFFELTKQFGMEEMPNRRQELIRAREAGYFWRGYHYPLFNSDQATWIVPQEGGLPYSTNGGDSEGNARFYYVTNFYTPLGKSLISALAGSLPEVVMLPQNPKKIDDINASKEADKYRKVFFFINDMGQKIKDVGRYFWTDGRTVGWIKQETNPKFGVGEDGEPMTQEVVEIGGVLEWKVPITASDQCEFHYASRSKEFSVAFCKDKWQDKAEKIKPGMAGPASDQFDRLCRLAVLQGTDSMYAGDTYAHLVTVTDIWIRRWGFALVKNETVRKELMEAYPDGVHVTFAGNEFMEAVPANMDDDIEVVLPQPGDGMAVASLGEFVIPVQKRVNNKINLAQEAWEKGTPMNFVDSKAVDEQGLKDDLASPETYREIKNPYPQQPLSNLFYKTELPQQPQDMMLSIEKDMGPVAQMVGGVQPALFGAPMQNAKTAAVYSQARDQALGSLSISYGPLKTFLANITAKAVAKAEDRDSDIEAIVPDEKNGGFTGTSVSISKLKAGRYMCKPVVDDGGIPESPSAQKAGLMQMVQFMGQNPAFQQLMQHPDNQYFLKQNTGLKGFEVPGADSRNKQLREIELMHDHFMEAKQEGLPTGPIQPDQADIQKVAQHDTLVQAAGGVSSNPKPSDLMQSTVPVDPEVDDHMVEYTECKRWLNSDEGWQAKELELPFYNDVRQHMIEHQRAMQQGVDAAKPVQDRIPNPAQAVQAQAAQAALQDHAQQQQQNQLNAGGPPVVPGGAPIQ
jgi:hypothetical protein